MKWKLLIIFLLCYVSTFATRYYVGSGGSNNNNGLSIGTRWLNLTKVNSFTFASGDSVLLQTGEVFAGPYVPRSNGVTLSSYGSGSKPIITGLTTITGWTETSPGSHLWDAKPSVPLKANCNILTVNGYPQAVGRYPNVGSYLVYQSANSTSITSNALTGFQNVIGAEVCFKNNGYSATKAAITGQSGNVLTYTFTQPIDNGSNTVSSPVSTPNFGFFLQRYAQSLDKQWEWYFNPPAKKMRIYSTVNPSTLTIKASYIDTLILLANHTNMTISNIAVEGAGMYGVESYLGANIRVNNCTFTNNTRAIYAWGCINLTIKDNTIRHSFNNAIFTRGSSNRKSQQVTISNNNIDSTGELLGMGLYWSNYNLKAIAAITTEASTPADFSIINNNIVRHTGYDGIEFQGSNVTVRKNVVDSFLGNLQDGGAIYTFTNNWSLNTINYVNRLIDSNFMSNALSGAWMAGDDITPDVCAAYMDDQAANCTWRHNTIFNVPTDQSLTASGGTGMAVQMNTPHDNIFIDNTIYNCNYFLALNKRHVAEVYKNVIKKNLMYQMQNKSQMFLFSMDNNLQLPTPHTDTTTLKNIAYMDSNWISYQLALAFRHYYSTDGAAYVFPPNFDLTAWKYTFIHELNCVLPTVTLTNSNTDIYPNPSDKLLVVNFPGFRKIDPKGVIYDNQATVGRWSSLILIDNGNSPQKGNIPPVSQAGNDVTNTLPTNSADLSGSGSTDADGTIASYQWTKISGPVSGTITTPNDINSTLTDLTAGIYNVRLKVVDNIGDSSIDFKQVTVITANQPPAAITSGNQTVQLPQNSTSVSGNASTDPENLSLTFHWAYASGPSGSTITSPNSAITTITNLVAGIYHFSLTVTDQGGLTNTSTLQITVNAVVPPVNQPPNAVAGPDQTITLPANTATVNASGSSDPEGKAITYHWVKLPSSPAGGDISTPNNASTLITGLLQGIYFFQVTANNPSLDSSNDVITITVNAAPLQPTVSAGNDTAITLPSNSLTLVSNVHDPQGSSLTYSWTKISGPATGTIVTPGGSSIVVKNLVAGAYIFNVQVTNSFTLSSSASVKVTVNPAPPLIPPVADAGAGQSITTPQNTAILVGTATDQDGSISSYAWVQISGPNSATGMPSTTATTEIGNLIVGTYLFILTATDNNALKGVDTIQINVVAPVNLPPIASAGGNFRTSATTITLNGSGSDQGGTIVSYQWVIVSQPAGSNAVITSPTSATTTVTGLTVGNYVFQLTVTDDGALTDSDAVIIAILVPSDYLWLLQSH